MNVILRPDPSGPFYELMPRASGGFRCQPYFADPDADNVMTAEEAGAYALTVQRLPDSLVIGDIRSLCRTAAPCRTAAS